jgi:hypothetical protein
MSAAVSRPVNKRLIESFFLFIFKGELATPPSLWLK